MNDRIKELRNALGLSQEELGKILGISKSGVSSIESGLRNVTEKHIKLLVLGSNVNESWLRTGEGEMFESFLKEDEFIRAAAEISKNNDDLAMQAVIEYWKLDEDSKSLLKNFLMHIVENIRKEKE